LAGKQYAGTINQIAGSPAVLDLLHLGLGADRHTASLVQETVLNLIDVDVAMTGVYQNRRRMTLTYPIINGARRVLWLVASKDKAEMVGRLRAGNTSIPTGRIQRDRALILADRAAAEQITQATKE
jgi:6-phosphogluconolactonase